MNGTTLSAALGLLVFAGSPLAGELSICFDHGCKSNAQVRLSADEWRRIGSAFGNAGSAVEERRSIARAIAAFERIVGQHTGTSLDRGGNSAGAGMPGQMDCIDESRNTTTYLRALERRGLLRWHSVAPRARRVSWFVFLHWTAVVVERGGESYAVDAWFRDNGQPPYVQRLSDWARRHGPSKTPQSL